MQNRRLIKIRLLERVERVRTSSNLSEEVYDRLFRDLVKIADDFTATAKKAEQAERILDRILAQAKETLPKGSNELYGFTQLVTHLQKDVTQALEALNAFGPDYDALNKRALRYKMR